MSDHPFGYETRWKKGQSGNPKGRPRGSLNLKTMAHALMEARVVMEKDGRTYECSRLERTMIEIAHRADEGELAAIKIMLREKHRWDALMERAEMTQLRLAKTIARPPNVARRGCYLSARELEENRDWAESQARENAAQSAPREAEPSAGACTKETAPAANGHAPPGAIDPHILRYGPPIADET